MPLLLCPNDNTSMQSVNRGGVEIDICPTCRGVWLDRGELAKLMESTRVEQSGQSQDRDRFEREVQDFHRSPDDWKRNHPFDSQSNRHRYDDDYNYKKKRKGLDIFDIFD